MISVFHRNLLSLIVTVVGLIGSIPNVRANVVNEEKEIYIVRPIFTEPAWSQTGVFFNTMMFDLPNAVSYPNPQVGFVLTPGFSWSIFDILELQFAFPLVLNPDASGQKELDAADVTPSLKDTPYWDAHPDFDLPGLVAGLKATVLGKKGEDKFFLAVGMTTSIPMFGSLQTNFMPPKSAPFHTNTMRFNPYVSLAYQFGIFSPQLQLGMSIRLPDKYYDPQNPPGPGGQLNKGQGYTDFFFNLALPLAFVFEGTAPMIELNGVVGQDGLQLFITPAVSFLPRSSPALIGFACMIPVGDADFRKNEGVRFMINFGYRFDALSLPAFWKKEEATPSATPETPPAGW